MCLCFHPIPAIMSSITDVKYAVAASPASRISLLVNLTTDPNRRTHPLPATYHPKSMITNSDNSAILGFLALDNLRQVN